MKEKYRKLILSLVKEGLKAFFLGWLLSILFILISMLAAPKIGILMLTARIVLAGVDTAELAVLVIQLTGLIFYSANWIPIASIRISPTENIFERVYLIPELAQNNVFFLIIFVAPIIVLIYSGYSLAKGKTNSWLSGAGTGAMLAIPYLIFMSIGTIVFTRSWVTGGTAFSIGPDIQFTVLMATVMCVVFGSIGGLLAEMFRNKTKKVPQLILVDNTQKSIGVYKGIRFLLWLRREQRKREKLV